MHLRLFGLLTTFLFGFLLVGCGEGPIGAEGINLGDVSGVVTLDGEPVKFALVTFTPTEGGRSSSAETDADGKYTLFYSNSLDGAEVGEHAVSIMPQEGGEPDFPDDFDPDTASQAEIDKFYAESAGTPIPDKYSGNPPLLTATVEGGANTFDFALTSE